MVTSIEINHKNVNSARKGQDVCIKIDPIPGESPKMFGRHFDETDMLVSKVRSIALSSLDLQHLEICFFFLTDFSAEHRRMQGLFPR